MSKLMTGFRDMCLIALTYTIGAALLILVLICLGLFRAHAMSKPHDCPGASFDKAIGLVLLHEGHLEIDKSDPGGITNYGLSLRYLRDLIKQSPQLAPELDLDGQKTIDAYDVKHLSLTEAMKIYRCSWWNKYNFGTLCSQQLADKYFDLSVNMGQSEAERLLQRAYFKSTNMHFKNLRELNNRGAMFQDKLLLLFCDEAAIYYQEITKEHPAFKRFIKGWLARVYDGVEVGKQL